MTKSEFLKSLHEKLSGLPRKEVEERLNFYCEMIEDRMEDGLSEEEAVAAVGSLDDIAAQIIEDIPLAKIARSKIKPKHRFSPLKIVLLALSSPIWLSLLIAAFAVTGALYTSLWSVIVALWAIFASVAVCAPALIVCGIAYITGGSIAPGIAMIGAGIAWAGLAIFLFFGCKAATGGMMRLTKKIVSGTKKCFIEKEGAQ